MGFYSDYPTEQGRYFSLTGSWFTSAQKANSACTQQWLTTSEGTKSKIRKAKRAGKPPLSIIGLHIKINPYSWILFVLLDFFREKILIYQVYNIRLRVYVGLEAFEHVLSCFRALYTFIYYTHLYCLLFLCPPRPSPPSALSHVLKSLTR